MLTECGFKNLDLHLSFRLGKDSSIRFLRGWGMGNGGGLKPDFMSTHPFGNFQPVPFLCNMNISRKFENVPTGSMLEAKAQINPHFSSRKHVYIVLSPLNPTFIQ